jgi:hypothetical protein
MRRARQHPRGRVLASSWYGRHLGGDRFEELIAGSRLAPLARIPAVRGALLWWLGRRYDLVVATNFGHPVLAFLALETLLPRRSGRLVLLEFIPGVEVPRRRAAVHRLLAPALRRSLAFAQVMTEPERAIYQRMFGLRDDQLRHIPWPGAVDDAGAPDFAAPRSGVVASGRSACDWPTVLAAAEGQRWPLTVVCSAADLDEVRALVSEDDVRILSELSPADHQAVVDGCKVYLLALPDRASSAGQIRVSNAAHGGAAVVAARASGLHGYVEDGRTALLFPPGDAARARELVNRLLANERLRLDLAEAAWERAQRWTMAEYVAALEHGVEAAAAGAHRDA